MARKNAKKISPVLKSQIEHLLKEYSIEHKISPKTISDIMSEFVGGFEFLRKYKKAFSIYGSARYGFRNLIYKEASLLSYKLSKDGFTIITGGGPGIMEAANKGAYEAGGKSVGLNIKLKHEQKVNKYVKESREFEYFFVRKTMLSFASQIYIFFPGGFGTLDEFFEMLMLIQTEKVPRIPIVLIDKIYWGPLVRWFEEYLYKESKAISEKDLKIYYLVDNTKEAYDLIKKLVKDN
jgi:hypothetical protein